MKRLLLAPVAIALFLAIAPLAQAGHAPGALNCPLPQYKNNPNKYALQVGTTVTCTIVGATDASGTTVPVIIQSSDLGNATVTGTLSGTTITFSYTAPVGGCNTSVVAYGTTGNLTSNTTFDGFAYVDANGNGISTCGDTTPPTCKLTATVTGPPKSIQVTVQDTGTGLASITPTATNATVSGADSLKYGSTGSVVVTATKTNQALGSTLKLVVKDVAGNTTTCDPLIPATRVASLVGGRTLRLGGLPNGLTTLVVRTGNRAATVTIHVNGHVIRLSGLRAHAVAKVSLSAWMVAGRHNRVIVQQNGSRGRSTVVIS